MKLQCSTKCNKYGVIIRLISIDLIRVIIKRIYERREEDSLWLFQ